MKQSLFTLAVAIPLAALALGSTMCEKPKTLAENRIDSAKLEAANRWDKYFDLTLTDTVYNDSMKACYNSICELESTIIWYKHATENQYKYKR